MNHSLGTEVETTAQWLEAGQREGAAALLRRVAAQRDHALRALADEKIRSRYPHAWRSARLRARRATAKFTSIAEQLDDFHEQWGADCHRFNQDYGRVMRANEQLRTAMRQLKVHAERAGWVPDPESPRLWRWRDGWWELARRRRNAKDGYPDSGWYLWGPTSSGHFGEWAARLKADATTEADRLITLHANEGAEPDAG